MSNLFQQNQTLNINYKSSDIQRICFGTFLQNACDDVVHSISYDTRKIHQGKSTLFACLKSENNDGHMFVNEAYEKGVRFFLIDDKIAINAYKDATFILVPSVLIALQKWAKHHRNLFKIPVIAITGSAGKTTIKEWLYHLLSDDYVVARSPKSFNSQLGVALSLFEINEQTEIAIIEAGISQKDEMVQLEDIIQPTLCVFTGFGLAHRENFVDENEHFKEKMLLFRNCKTVFAPEILKKKIGNSNQFKFSNSSNQIDESNKNLIQSIAQNIGLSDEKINLKIQSLPKIALRMEHLDGINSNVLLFDAFNWNLDGLEQALGYQLSLSKKKNRFLVLAQTAFSKVDQIAFDKLVKRFSLTNKSTVDRSLLVFGTIEIQDINEVKDAVLLFKGAQSELMRLASRLKVRNHNTFVEINLPALKHNISIWKSRVPKSCKLLAMVKAQSYGAELTKISEFLVQQGISYLGVAYADEGVELRKNGVTLPIMVMNSDASTWQDCIHYKLEPSLFSFEQMEGLVTELIHEGIDHFPIHLKFDTGMHRLGFQIHDLQKVVQYVKSQPEIKVESVFSHLADADNTLSRDFTVNQLKEFQHISEIIQKSLAYPILRHILNSEGLSNYPEYCFDMVRMGIGMFGISSNENVQKSLRDVLSWKSTISQIKTLKIGDSVGYGRSYVADKETTIAIIPVGYADGFKRQLSDGKGGVFVNGNYFQTIGRVCMDMLMINCTGANLAVDTEVEIIGEHQTIREIAQKCNTIPYEIMTGLSARMPRVFIEEVD
jgi:Alr-MurF fusion protein